MKDYMKKLRRNTKALSPIFAVLILIAIAVIAGIVIYLFTSGTLGGGPSNPLKENLVIETVSADDTTDTVLAYVKCTSGGDIIVTDALLKDASGNTVGAPLTLTAPGVTIPASGALTAVTCNFTGLADILAGYTYSVVLITQDANQFPSTNFKG